jgi:hypothetical protein
MRPAIKRAIVLVVVVGILCVISVEPHGSRSEGGNEDANSQQQGTDGASSHS